MTQENPKHPKDPMECAAKARSEQFTRRANMKLLTVCVPNTMKAIVGTARTDQIRYTFRLDQRA